MAFPNEKGVYMGIYGLFGIYVQTKAHYSFHPKSTLHVSFQKGHNVCDLKMEIAIIIPKGHYIYYPTRVVIFVTAGTFTAKIIMV